MESRKLSKYVLTSLLCVIFFNGCDLFNLNIPEYVDKYTNTAAVGNYHFATPVTEGKGNISENYWIIPPDGPTEITLRLRNPREYNLQPVIDYENTHGDWVSGSLTSSIIIDGVTISADHEKSDIVKVTVGKGGGPAVGNTYRLNIRLMDTETGRLFDEGYKLPLLRCSEAPAVPENISIDKIEKASGEEFGYGLKMSWTQAEQKHIGGPDRMTISAGSDLGSVTYTRTLSASNEWSKWSDGNGNEFNSGTNYEHHAFEGKKSWPSQTYRVTMSFSNRDGLSSGGSFEYDGTSDWFYVNNEGTENDPDAGNSPTNPTTLDDALTKINNSNTVKKANIVVVGNINSAEPLTIGDGKTIILNTDEAADYSVSLKNGSQGSLFTLGTNSTMTVGPVNGGKSLSLTNSSNSTNNAALITVNSGGSLTLSNGVSVSGNNYDGGYGGGIYVNGGAVTMNSGSSVSSNGAGWGGGIYANSGAVILGSGSIITSNSAGRGAGIYLATGGTLAAENGSKIITNTASLYGGGVYAASGGILTTETGSQIISNTAGTGGGGVYILKGGTFNMNGGSISGNNAAAGTVSGNATGGGGLLIQGTVNMNGGTIGANKVGELITAAGAGVVVRETGTFAIHNSARVSADNDVYLISGRTISLGATVSGSDTIARITPSVYSTQQVLSGSYTSTYYSRFNLEQPATGDDKYSITTTGYIRQSLLEVEISGNKSYYYYLSDAAASVGTGQTAVITMLGDLTSTAPTAIAAGTKTITLQTGSAGRNITKNGTGSLFTINSGVTLILKPSGSNALTLTGNSSNAAAMITVNTGGTLEMNASVSIIKNTNTSSLEAAGVYVNGGTFNMKGGIIGGSEANKNNGRGVRVTNSGTFNMTGGTVSYNSASSGGGVYVSNGTFTMSNATISNNSATGTYGDGGGGVYVSTNGVFTMGSNAYIISNTAAANGGGVYVVEGTFIMNGGVIGGSAANKNTASGKGGGIYAYDASTTRLISFTINSGNISYNEASSDGGGIYISLKNNSTIKNAYLTGNKSSSGGGGGMYIISAKDMTIEKTTFTSNTAPHSSSGSGGGMTIRESVVSIIDCFFEKNSTSGSGGGIFAYKADDTNILTIERSTFSENSANTGGGINNYQSSPTIINCTFWGNSSSHTDARYGGGAIFNGTNSNLTVKSSTFTANSTKAAYGGAIFNSDDSYALMLGSIVIGNTAAGYRNETGGVIDQGNNLVYNSTTVADVFSNVSDGVAQLVRSGGFTPIVMIKSGGEAHDRIYGVPSWGIPATDQRGTTRPQGGNYHDIGAVERTASDP